MRNYEFTERGKIFIALLLVLLLLVLPSAILAFKVMAREPSQPPSGQSPGEIGATPSVADPQQTEETDDPPPENGGGFNHTDLPPTSSDESPVDERPPNSSGGPGEQTDSSPGEQANGSNGDSQENGNNGDSHANPEDATGGSGDQPPSDSSSAEPPEQTGPVLSEGVLTFIFSPATQTALDTQTSSLIAEFLRSPKNTKNSIIVIETLKLADKDAETLMKAMTSAFSARGVPSQRLEYVSRSSETAGGEVEVTVYYIESNSNRK